MRQSAFTRAVTNVTVLEKTELIYWIWSYAIKYKKKLSSLTVVSLKSYFKDITVKLSTVNWEDLNPYFLSEKSHISWGDQQDYLLQDIHRYIQKFHFCFNWD